MKTGRNTKDKTVETVKKKCVSCDKEQNIITHYYLSNNDLHKKDGRFPSCKSCVLEHINYENMQTIFDVLSQMNRPFLTETWNRSMAESTKTNKDLFGMYYKNVILNSKELTWKNSVFEKKESAQQSNMHSTEFAESDDFNDDLKIHFKVTPEILMRWGQNHEADDYIKLEDFYHKMKSMNKIETPQEETYLKKLAMISLKMDQELEAGNYNQVKQLGDLFSKYMADSKFRAMDKSDADKSGGIRTFGAIFAEVEAEGHIPPWEEFRKLKGLTQDLVDKTIMHIENFTLRLNKIERMVEPPSDTPKIEDGDV